MKNSIILLLILLFSFPFGIKAQELRVESPDSITIEASNSNEAFLSLPDSSISSATDSIIQDVLTKGNTSEIPVINPKATFIPNPTKATLLAIVPGLGQIYNRKYWKLPLVYGGLMGCVYAVTWNNTNYQDYKQAYFDVLSSDPEKNDSWKDFVSWGEDPETAKNSSAFWDRLKRQKDYFRRYRDLSIIIMVGVYAISIIDAYVDAQLFTFDISPDLSMHVEPVYMPKTPYNGHTYGINWSVNF
ncbi:DUF5683 domain-containing protein [Parabacteroides sp. PF5-9]|uniref:DUF5683 domain-containing protein n=1 Tax=Parabacteroides sp. PF5-9 TaxID=1742404 RepID=UPI002473BC45|nr:DUF5683 domain-containing protein [Parabacteroides sp. PF5-9]MDH6358797.1 hypothetical protein [Parabacteroides sp. PF5-9]